MRIVLAVMLAATLGMPALAGPASERVFSRTALEQIADDQQAIYTHVRTGEVRPLENGEIRVTVKAGTNNAREAVVTMGETGQLRPVSKWPASSGNPILPIFLESTLRTVAEATGGSEFYIRNRIKDALGSAGTIEDTELELNGKVISATEITFEPFVNDKNRARLGDYAGLKMIFVVSETLPGDIVRFSAVTGADGPYSEEISFEKLVEEE